MGRGGGEERDGMGREDLPVGLRSLPLYAPGNFSRQRQLRAPHPRAAAARGWRPPRPRGWGRCLPGTPRPAVSAAPGQAAAVAARSRSMCQRCPAGGGSAPGPSPAAPALHGPPLRTRARRRPPPRRCHPGGQRGGRRPQLPAVGFYLARCFTGGPRRLRWAGAAGEGPGSAPPRRELPGPGSCGAGTCRSVGTVGSTWTQRYGGMSYAVSCRHPPVTPRSWG